MMSKTIPGKVLLACLCGGLAPLSLSPVDIWPLAIISITGLFFLLQNSKPKHGAKIGWAYGLGFFGVGASWMFVSIHIYGNTSILLAGFLTFCFVAAIALLFSLQCWCYQRFFCANSSDSTNPLHQALSFSCLWVMFEWLRSWLFTGFPWLYLGYGHVTAPLAGIAPIFGVMAISFVLALSGSWLCLLLQYYLQKREINKAQLIASTALLLCLWLLPSGLTKIQWVEEQPQLSKEVGLVQANIDQSVKFSSALLQQNLTIYEQLSQPLWDTDITIWSETAIPLYYDEAGILLEAYSEKAKLNNSALITGIFSQSYNDDYSKTHNSIISIGNGNGIYHKQKMVPFGEYVPFLSIVDGFFKLFDLPMSSLQPGPQNQEMLTALDLTIAPFICYEVVYPDFVRKQAITADFLLTISNDSWFGGSFQPLQHLQMAAMRALENGRYMVRVTSNGVSAIINEKGEVVLRSQQFQAQVLRGEVKVFHGRTPFSYWGNLPLLLFCSIILALLFLSTKEKARTS